MDIDADKGICVLRLVLVLVLVLLLVLVLIDFDIAHAVLKLIGVDHSFFLVKLFSNMARISKVF